MASIVHSFSLILFSFLLFAIPTFSIQSPQFSPSPSPEVFSPSPSPELAHSPPSPPPSDLSPSAPSPVENNRASSDHKYSPSPSPAPSPTEDNGASSDQKESPSPSPAPAPDVAADVGHDDRTTASDLKTNDDSGGMNGGKKAGITIGVIGAACIVGVGAVVHKKRQRNIRRSQYSYVTRREIL